MTQIRVFYESDINRPFSLCPEEVHLWLIRWHKIENWIVNHWSLLEKPDEIYVERFKVQEDRFRSAAGKIITKLLASKYLHIPLNCISIRTGNYGKPEIVLGKSPHLAFSISHSGDYVVLAFGLKRVIGVDVEQVKELPEYLELAQHFFTQEESSEIKEIRHFYNYWTAKEAYVKALGVGLQKPLDSFY
ncbi:4'-phosphopantetheinyl transferase superfamily protein, partial [Mediterraneibacter glycyrrhizinilyticus]